MSRGLAGRSGTIVAIALPSLVAWLLALPSVRVVQDVGEIPHGIPELAVPAFAHLSFELVTSALAISLGIVVQGAGVSQSAPNPDGSPRRASRDFIAPTSHRDSSAVCRSADR